MENYHIYKTADGEVIHIEDGLRTMDEAIKFQDFVWDIHEIETTIEEITPDENHYYRGYYFWNDETEFDNTDEWLKWILFVLNTLTSITETTMLVVISRWSGLMSSEMGRLSGLK